MVRKSFLSKVIPRSSKVKYYVKIEHFSIEGSHNQR